MVGWKRDGRDPGDNGAEAHWQRTGHERTRETLCLTRLIASTTRKSEKTASPGKRPIEEHNTIKT